MQHHRAIGIMSGSSLDGLDVCYAEFREENGQWRFQHLQGKTIPFPDWLLSSLLKCDTLPSIDLFQLDADLGVWIGQMAKAFIEKHHVKPSVIASHGHTVFHEPQKGFSVQIGHGQAIANETKLDTVTNFRSKDVLSGGQGAPLVPVGQLALFPGFGGFLNLGGIANCSVKNLNNITAWDVAPCNQVLNHLAQLIGLPYDDEGREAAKGQFMKSWYDHLVDLGFFQQPPPKSLSNQWVAREVIAKIPNGHVNDLMHTYCVFLRDQLIKSVPGNIRVMVTGGGAFHAYLLKLLNDNDKGISFELPAPELINFKEALVFAFMGVLRKLDRPNVLSSVTGATHDSCCGQLYHP